MNKGAQVVNYRYDGLGRRIAKSVDGVETRYVLDGLNVLEERNGANALTAVNLHAGLDQLLMRQDYVDSATYWAHTDHLGSVEALTDATGDVVERYRYSSFGQLTVMDGEFTLKPSNLPLNPFTYTGREWEPELNIYFYRARFMDPRMGRWLASDPSEGAILLPEGSDLLVFVGNNPINFIDTLGLSKGGVRNLNVNNGGQILTKKSTVTDVSVAVKAARAAGKSASHIKALEGLLKVIKRGGSMEFMFLPDVIENVLNKMLNPPNGKYIDVPYDENGNDYSQGKTRRVWISFLGDA